MIKYKLKCEDDFCSNQKEFDGWFQNIEAFENQKNQGLINCPICGSCKIVKVLTTPSLKTTKKSKDIKNKTSSTAIVEDNFVINANSKNVSTILRTIKKEIQKNSTYVGKEFVSQVRSMKEGKVKEKPIHGHGSNKDIQELRNEGIDIVNVPWVSDDH